MRILSQPGAGGPHQLGFPQAQEPYPEWGLALSQRSELRAWSSSASLVSGAELWENIPCGSLAVSCAGAGVLVWVEWRLVWVLVGVQEVLSGKEILWLSRIPDCAMRSFRHRNGFLHSLVLRAHE